jgi:hypothetical protein
MATNTIKKIKINGTTYTLRDDRIDSLDYTKTVAPGGYISKIKQTNGLIEVEESELNNNLSDPTLNDSIAPKTSAVKNYVDSAISSVSKINFVIVDTLPTASASTRSSIYLVAHSHSDTDDTYDEYITVTSDNTTYSWEKIGNTDVSLSGLVTDVSVANAQFKGTTVSHNHTATTTVKTSAMSGTAPVTVTATKISITPAGTVTTKLATTPVDVVSSGKVTMDAFSTSEAPLEDVYFGQNGEGYYDSETETLDLSLNHKLLQPNWTFTFTPTTTSINNPSSISSTFTGKETSFTPNVTASVNLEDFNHTHTATTTTNNIGVTPNGAVIVDLNVTKHS